MTLLREEILLRYKYPEYDQEKGVPTDRFVGANESCGDRVSISIKIDDLGKIEWASHNSKGCAISVVSADMLCEWMVGRTLNEVESMSLATLLDLTGEVNPGRLKCVKLPLDVIKKGINDSSSNK